MNKPEVKLYDSYSQLLEDKITQAKKELDDIKSKLKRGWFQPSTAEEVSCLDVENIPKKFERSDLQEAYTKRLKEVRPPIEQTTIKMQNAFIEADEQAYRIRHCSLPRALATGYMESMRWSEGALHYVLTERINYLGNLASKDYESKSKED